MIDALRRRPLDAAAALAVLIMAAWIAPGLMRWAIIDATWTGETKAACTEGGACWAIVTSRWRQVLAGFYPKDHLWRVAAAALVLLAGVAPLLRRRTSGLALATAPAAVLLAYGVMEGAGVLPRAPTDYWGGFFLNLFIGLGASIFALPLGIALALGRTSRLPVVKGLCVAFIEVIRGSPLIVLLFAAAVVAPLFTPAGMTLDKLTRAMIVIILFEAAYMAEAVRGGLAGVPAGQVEAARALGLDRWRTLVFVVLPQALRIATPALVNSFIGLFKDTTLIYVIGVLDITGVLRNAVTDFAWQGLETEAYVFVAAVFWVFCFGLSRWSASLERRLSIPGKSA
ncbi:amino acid ABC transporter permease [Caulobacter segnis]|uniref:amino acid ABC transporter permease n=1 Tax=Caulobacter segnis TaxID=88688 RepID=UPI00240F829B|nr:amino acid ABC transporter permease [Caulobacter segnis]MDG2522937.1 amino acid ABC transporter permease [Caulobacter segnis]